MTKTPDSLLFTRTLRTPSSERFLVQDIVKPDVDVAAIDIHYLDNRVVTATVVVLEREYAEQAMIQLLVETVDVRLLPMACLNDGDFNFTVVEGRVIGQFTNE